MTDRAERQPPPPEDEVHPKVIAWTRKHHPERLSADKAERQVGERLSEQIVGWCERLAEHAYDRDPKNKIFISNAADRIADAAREQARQLAEAERENGRVVTAFLRLREATKVLVHHAESVNENVMGNGLAHRRDALRAAIGNAEVALNRAALHPPDPPAAPAEGSEAATEVEA